MDDTLSQMLLLGEDHCPLAEFVDYTLWVCGSFLTARVVENNVTINYNSQVHIPSPAALSLPTSDWTRRPSPECPKQLESLPAPLSLSSMLDSPVQLVSRSFTFAAVSLQLLSSAPGLLSTKFREMDPLAST